MKNNRNKSDLLIMRICLKLSRFLILIILLGYFGCSSKVSKEKKICIAGEWNKVGLQDGELASNRNAYWEKTCQLYNIEFNKSSYEESYTMGVKSYCTTLNALKVGLRGDNFRFICKNAKKYKLENLHQLGMQIFLLKRKVAQVNYNLKTYYFKLNEVNQSNKEKIDTQKVNEINLLKSKIKENKKIKMILKKKFYKYKRNSGEPLEEIEKLFN
jgi:hypothetical protein